MQLIIQYSLRGETQQAAMLVISSD